MEEMINWLRKIGLEHYSDEFERHAIGFDVIGQLTDADMSELGIALGDRYRLKTAILEYKSEESLLTEDQAHFRQLTVLFSDLVGSTQLSTRLNAEMYRIVMRRYQQTVANVMNYYGGTITQIEGDGAMVLFGFPVAYEDAPDRAICAGLDSVAAVAKLQSVGDKKLQSRIGIATGEVVVGDQYGSGPSRHLAVSGSTPNLAARLQTLAELNSVVASDTTMRLTKTAFETTTLPLTSVKGIAEPIQAFMISGEQTAEAGSQIARVHRAPMVARESEHNQLNIIMQSTLNGAGMVAVVLGEAGIGKSRLVEEVIKDVPSEQILTFCCLPRYQNSMLHPLVQQLRDSMCLSALSTDAELRKQVVSLRGMGAGVNQSTISAFESLLSLSGDEPEKNEAKLKKNELFDAILFQMRRLVEDGVSVILVEDLHWADPTSLDLLAQIAENIESLPLLLMFTTRPDRIPEFATRSAVCTVKLSPLTMSDSSNLVKELTRTKLLSARDIERILDRCDGVPLYLEEITRAMMDNVDVSILERRTTDIPETLRDLLMARLDRLGSGALLAQIASVLGRSFTVRQVQTIAVLDDKAVEVGLEELEKAGLLIPLEGNVERTYQFNHSLTANAAYTSLLSEHKVILHAKVARMLDADPISAEREPETAAGHYEWAGELEPAIRLRELAGNRASVRSANVEAAYHFNKAVTLTMQLPVNTERHVLELRLRLELGTQLSACYGNASHQGELNYKRAKELCEHVPDQPLLWLTLYGLWSTRQVNGRLREAKVLGKQLIDLAKRLDSTSMLLRAHRAHGLCQFAMGEFDDSRFHLERAIDTYDPMLHSVRETGDVSDNLVLAKCNLGWLCCFQGETELALELHKEAILRAEQLEHQHSLAFALALSVATHQALEDHDNTKILAQRLVSHSQTHGYPYWLSWGKMLLQWSNPTKNFIKDSNEFDIALAAYEKTGGRMMNAYFITLRAELEIGRELFSEALASLYEAEQLVDETATCFYMSEIPRLRAVIHTQKGDLEEAENSLKYAKKLAVKQGNMLLKNRIDATGHQLLGID